VSQIHNYEVKKWNLFLLKPCLDEVNITNLGWWEYKVLLLASLRNRVMHHFGWPILPPIQISDTYYGSGVENKLCHAPRKKRLIAICAFWHFSYLLRFALLLWSTNRCFWEGVLQVQGSVHLYCNSATRRKTRSKASSVMWVKYWLKNWMKIGQFTQSGRLLR
jgi:hypothetical protein